MRDFLRWAKKNGIALFGMTILSFSVFIFLIDFTASHSADELGASLASVLFCIAIALIMVDRLSMWRQSEETRERLVRDLLSQVTSSAVRAVDELRYHGWLDETLREEKNSLDSATLAGADLSDANLERANLRYANLQDAYLARANLEGADLVGANLQGAYLNDANLKWARLSDANLERAYLPHTNLLGAHLYDTNLQEAVLFEANLQGARLIGANLQGAMLLEANLLRTNLRRANLEGVHIAAETLTSVTNLDGAILPDGSTLEQWALNLLEEDKITEEIYKTFMELPRSQEEEE